jgi:hypothetical protein
LNSPKFFGIYLHGYCGNQILKTQSQLTALDVPKSKSCRKNGAQSHNNALNFNQVKKELKKKKE